jgi:hypothetical protein
VSIALSTIVLFVLLLPGIAYRRLYYSEEFSQQYFRENLFLVFTATIVPSLIFQLVGFWMARALGHPSDLTVLGQLMAGGDDSIAALGAVERQLDYIVLHQLLLIALAGAAGYLGRKAIRRWKWDRKYKLFRYQNNWHYLLRGEIFDFPRAAIDLQQDRVEEIEIVFVSTIQDTAAGTYLYDGVLVDYELARDGGLLTISLKSVKRRRLVEDAPKGQSDDPDLRYYPVRGNLLVLKYAELKNLNLTYYTLENVSEDPKLSIPRQIR